MLFIFSAVIYIFFHAWKRVVIRANFSSDLIACTVKLNSDLRVVWASTSKHCALLDTPDAGERELIREDVRCNLL
jgi:hypothetical protein